MTAVVPAIVPAFRINVVQAMEALFKCAQRRQPPQAPQVAQTAEAGDRTPAGSAMVDVALAMFGFRSAELWGDHLATAWADFPLVVSPFFTVGAVAAFHAAARAEGGGASWAQAVCAARFDVLRLMATAPDSVLEGVAEGQSLRLSQQEDGPDDTRRPCIEG